MDSTTEKRAAHEAVLLLHARLGPGGRPTVCEPPTPQDRRHETPKSKKKVIFIDGDHADAAALALADIYGGPPQRSYPCPQSRTHYHLTRVAEWQERQGG